MTETLEAAAPSAEVQPQGMNKTEAVAKILAQQNESFDKADREERLALAKRRSKSGQPWNNPLHGMDFENPSLLYTLDELKAIYPLDRDRLNYGWVNDVKGTVGKFAKNVHGLLSIGKQKGRRKPRMNKHQQAIKSESLRLFKSLMEQRAYELKAVCKNDGIDYLGIPESMIPEVGARAAKLGMAAVVNKRRAKARKANRRQQFSRKVNAGTITKSTSEVRFVNRGSQYGK